MSDQILAKLPSSGSSLITRYGTMSNAWYKFFRLFAASQPVVPTQTGIMVFDGSDIISRSITTGSPSQISVTNGGGVTGNPTITLNQNNITAVGTITSGVWSGTPIDLATKASGNLPVDNLNSGTNASVTTFWRGDGSWQPFPGVNTFPKARATMSGNQAVAGTGTPTKIVFDTETYDTNGNYDISTYRFTPTVAGKYIVNTSLDINFASSGGTWVVYLYKNGSVYSTFGNNILPGVYSTNALVLSDTVDVNGSTDYLEIFFSQNTGLSKNVLSGNSSFVVYNLLP